MQIHRKLIDSLYVEAMLLADETRAYFDQIGRSERDGLDPMTRVAFSCESLKVTTRLMHIIAWLLTQRAIHSGELSPTDALEPGRRLGRAPETDEVAVSAMPSVACTLIRSSIDLYRRVQRLDIAQVSVMPAASPARTMQDRLASAF